MDKTKLANKVKKKLSIQSKPEILTGTYANAVKVEISESEVMLDFAFIYERGPEEDKGEMVARVILPAMFAKKAITDILGAIESSEKSLKTNANEKPKTD